MSYNLGIDLGTTYTAGAIERSGTVEALTLGNRTASVPSVVSVTCVLRCFGCAGVLVWGVAATARPA